MTEWSPWYLQLTLTKTTQFRFWRPHALSCSSSDSKQKKVFVISHAQKHTARGVFFLRLYAPIFGANGTGVLFYFHRKYMLPTWYVLIVLSHSQRHHSWRRTFTSY